MTKRPAYMAEVRRRQIEEALEPWRALSRSRPPGQGWIRAVRQALGMTTRQLADRIRTRQSNVVRLEKAEATGSASLRTLHEAAQALDCELVYAIVPRRQISEILQERAEDKARTSLASLMHTMALEAQTPTDKAYQEMLRQRTQEFLTGRPGRLWEESLK